MKREQKGHFSIREDKQHHLEVHVAGFCFRNRSGKIQLLVGKRQKSRNLFPECWECGGGQVNVGENFKEALHRQFFEEFGIAVIIVQPLLVYEILRPKGPKIPGIKFLCISADNGKENIKLNLRELSEFAWVTEKECEKLHMIPGVPEQAKTAFALARRLLERTPKSKPEKVIGFNVRPDTSSKSPPTAPNPALPPQADK